MKISGLTVCALASACVLAGGAVAQEMGDGTFELPREVVSAATAFEHYMASAASVDPGFSSSAGVLRSLRTAASYEPAQLEEGMIAYGAIAALQDDAYVAGVERAAGRGDEREAFAERLIENPFAATQIDGAPGAARRIESALAAKAAPLVSAGARVKSAAYSVQRQAWSQVMVSDAQGRLAEVKILSASRAAPSEDDNQALMQMLAGVDPRTAANDAPAGYGAIEARALALAAEAVIGRAHGADRDRLSPLFTEADSAQCLRMAKLNLYQCMAVAGPEYEDIYCMGQHALYDTGQCVSEAAHGSPRSWAATLAARPTDGGGSAAPMAARHTLRISPN